MPLLSKLLNQGRFVAIEQGHLVVKPLNNAIPDDQREKLLFEIATATSTNLLRYESYTTGFYNKGHYGGVTLQFTSHLSDTKPYAIFNANLKRQRASKNGKKGDRLPNGQFSVTNRFDFYKFWERCQLSQPQSASRYYERMGNLGKVLLTGDYSKDNKLTNHSLNPANISHNELLTATGLKVTHKERISNAQATHKERIRVTHKETKQTQVLQGFQPDGSTCAPKYVNKLISKHVSKCSNNSIYNSNKKEELKERKKPQNQTNEEWLIDYGN